MLVVELHDKANGLVKRLNGATHAAFQPVLNADGAGSFRIHRSDPDVANLGILTGGIDGYVVHLLRKGQFESAFTDRFSFVVEAVGFGLDQAEEQSAWITVAGRGTLCLLEDRTCWPPGFDGINASSISSQWQIYAAQPGGAIMDAELDRSAGRFALAITHSVQTSTIPQYAKLRFDNLRLLHDALVQSGPMDAQMYGLDYRCVDHRGTDKSATVQVQLGLQDSLLGLTMARDARAVKNWIIAQGTGEGINSKLAVASDAPSIAALRRREGFLDARQVDVQSQLALTAAGSLSQFKAVDQRITVKFSDSQHTQLYRDFDLGDTIMLATQPLGILAPYRVVGYSVADTDAEIEDISLELNSMRQEYLIKLLQGTVLPAVSSLSVLNRLPQGAPWLDSQGYPDSCDPSFPFHFDAFVPSRVLQINSVKLSFFLQAFRSPVSGASTVTSGSSSAASSSSGSNHQHTTPAHSHIVAGFMSGTPLGATAHKYQMYDSSGFQVQLDILTPSNLDLYTYTASGSATSGSEGSHTHGIPHTHNVTPSLIYGIFEGAVATGVTVKINGIDRTVALGGGTGFTTSQTELEVGQWFTIGALNTVDLTPSGIGRILGHLSCYGYIQSA